MSCTLKLLDGENELTTEAVDAKKKFEEVVDKLKKDMKENGYQELSQWKGHGVGDVILAAKYRFIINQL